MVVAVGVAVPLAVTVVMAMTMVVVAMVVVIVVMVSVGHRSLCLTAAAPDQWRGLRPTSASARRVAAESLADHSCIRASICAPSASRGT